MRLFLKKNSMTLPINSIYVLNKPSGVGSNFYMKKFKNLLPKKIKIGFMGTLDPLASGVLPIATGAFTKLIPYINQDLKVYETKILFGAYNECLDLEGFDMEAFLKDFSEESFFTKEQINTFLNSLKPSYNQVPPNFSAKWVNGVRSYDLARKGVDFKLEPQKVDFFNFEILDFTWPYLSLKIEVGKGFYVRSLVRDIASNFNTTAIMVELNRTKSGPFDLNNLQALDNFQARSYELDEVLDINFLEIKESDYNAMKFGNLFVERSLFKSGLNLLMFGKIQVAIVLYDGENLKIIKNLVA